MAAKRTVRAGTSRKAIGAATALVRAMHRAHSLSEFFSADTRTGNAFVKVDRDIVAMTPTGDKFNICLGGLSLVDISTGLSVNGIRQSTESLMYARILEKMPETTAGIHLHGRLSPPFIRAFGADALEIGDFAESDYYLGKKARSDRVVITKGRSGSDGLAKMVAKAFADGANVVVIEGSDGEYHGTVAISALSNPDAAIMEALNRLVDIEYMAGVKMIERKLKRKA